MKGPFQPRVLIVDDEEGQRASLAEMASALGFAVATASDGEEALEQQAALAADVIVTDLMMPRLDGFDLLKRLDSIGDRTPTIVLTGVGGIEQGISVVHDLKGVLVPRKTRPVGHASGTTRKGRRTEAPHR